MKARSNAVEIPARDSHVNLGAILSGSPETELPANAPVVQVQIISNGGVPRWVLPENASLAVPVLKSWKPYRLTSRLQWSAILAFCRLNFLAALPGTERHNLRCDFSYWKQQLPGFSARWATVVYIGNHSPTRKAILFFLDKQREVRAVAKVPIYAAAAGAILNEAKMLMRMKDLLPVPRVLFIDESKGIAAQTWAEGINVPLSFGPEQLEMLTCFASPTDHVMLSDSRAELEQRIVSLRPEIEPSLLCRALSLMDNHEPLRACVEHGDFAPWNLRRLEDGRLTLLDWEWAREHGYPWQDICRYFYVTDYLFRESADVWQKLTQNPLLLEYRRRFQLSDDAVRGLTVMYLLRSLCNEHAEGNQDRVEYAARKIHEIIDAEKRAKMRTPQLR